MTITRKLHSKNCNPNIQGKTVKHRSCMTPEVLKKVRKYYNKYNPNNMIKSHAPRKIWNDLKEKLHHCDNEMCWLDEFRNVKLKSTIKNRLFAPNKPSEWQSDPNTWLTNFDILKVLNQYEKKYSCFKLFGPSPIDFDDKYFQYGGQCVSNDICTFELGNMLKKGIHKMGFIFNLSKHREPGSHWVSLFVDTKKGFILYFDSNGVEAPNEVDILVNRIMAQGKNLDQHIDFKYIQNTFSHQRSNTECGMYSLYFMITLVNEKINGKMAKKQKLLDHFLKQRIEDEYVFKRRNIYFNE